MEILFKHFNFDINLNAIQEIFKQSDHNKISGTLNFQQFLNCLVDENLDNKFNSIIKNTILKNHNNYTPLTYSAMLTYLSFQ